MFVCVCLGFFFPSEHCVFCTTVPGTAKGLSVFLRKFPPAGWPFIGWNHSQILLRNYLIENQGGEKRNERQVWWSFDAALLSWLLGKDFSTHLSPAESLRTWSTRTLFIIGFFFFLVIFLQLFIITIYRSAVSFLLNFFELTVSVCKTKKKKLESNFNQILKKCPNVLIKFKCRSVERNKGKIA